jgi:hypothetical protein
MNRKSLVMAFLLLLALTLSAQSQITRQSSQQEQSSFGTEELPGETLVKRPVPVPDTVLQILKTDDGVKSCLEYNPLVPGQLLGSWFIASEIHLDGPNERDLVILPTPHPGDTYMCFHSVSGIGQFWVFRKIGERYQLVLKASGTGLLILKTRNNGYRSIQTGSVGQAGRYVTTITFRFDGQRYREYRNITQEQP